MTPTELEQMLRLFRPTDIRYHHHKKLVYTAGIKFLIDYAQGLWLVCAIGFHQNDEVMTNNPELKQYQCWKLSNGRTPMLCCYWHRLHKAPAFGREVRRTSFPLKKLELFVANGCLMLPSEYPGP